MTRRYKRYVFLVCMILVIGIAGCNTKESQEDTAQAIEVEKVLSLPDYKMDVVRRGEITNVAEVDCIYMQMLEQKVTFDVDNEVVYQVYVEEGDSVKKGDLLVSLEITEVKENIEDLEYSIAYQNLMLEHTKELEELDLKARRSKYEVKISQITDQKMKNEENKLLIEDLNQMKESYRLKIEELEDDIAINQYKLDAYKKQYEDSMLYAEMDGTVSYIKDLLAGSLTQAEERIMTIIDDSVCSFVAKDVEYLNYFNKEQEVTINVGKDDSKKEYLAFPVDISEKEENTIYFELSEVDYDLDIGTKGVINIILDSNQDALYINKAALHTAGDKYYVYVSNDEGLRSIQYVEIGIQSDEAVEIVSGLEEGDYVIIK